MTDSKGILLVISGPSGSGKGEIVKRILERRNDVALSVSATTRAPRTGETNGISYHFMTKERFREKLDAGDFLEYNEYNGNFYGTPKSEVEKQLSAGMNLILEIDVHGAKNVKRVFPEAILVMVAPPDFRTLETRLRGRGDDVPEEVIRKRLDTARSELEQIPFYDHLVVNRQGMLEDAVSDVISIISAEKSKVSRNPGFIEKFYE